MIVDKACFERGCACYDDRVDGPGVEVVEKTQTCPTCEALARAVMLDQTYHDRATELLQRCENEMRYAGWDKFESDNSARNGIYEQVKNFLEKQP
jgi:hypothetical protein